MAEFGSQDTGVFNKDKLDVAMLHENYAYNPLSIIQKDKAHRQGTLPTMYMYDGRRAPANPFRTMGVDWDKYQASSSILILDYDVIRQKFKVIKRIEVPKSEYSYDAAVNMIVELNEQYNPSWIYCDRGAGEYQIERLHIIGDENPGTGLKNKVKGWQFKNVIEVMNPITKEKVKEPMKPFMVNQLQIAFEREKIMLSPYDDLLHKQLVDYEVLRQSATGVPVFTSENEHFIDALGLAYLAFVLEFTELTDSIKRPEFSSKISHTSTKLGEGRVNAAIAETASARPSFVQHKVDNSDLRGDRPNWFKVNVTERASQSSWGSRRGNVGRSSW